MGKGSLTAVITVAQKLSKLGIDYVFVGGSIVELLLDNPDLTPIRPTDDIDVIIEVFSHSPYTEVEAKLRGLGFEHDMREDAPLCRWIIKQRYCRYNAC